VVSEQGIQENATKSHIFYSEVSKEVDSENGGRMRREEDADADADANANDDELQSSNSKRKLNTRTRNISVFSYLTL